MGPARPQKATPKNPARLPSGNQREPKQKDQDGPPGRQGRPARQLQYLNIEAGGGGGRGGRQVLNIVAGGPGARGRVHTFIGHGDALPEPTKRPPEPNNNKKTQPTNPRLGLAGPSRAAPERPGRAGGGRAGRAGGRAFGWQPFFGLGCITRPPFDYRNTTKTQRINSLSQGLVMSGYRT